MPRTVRYQGAGVSLAATVSGDANGRPVLLLHGGGQTRGAWDATAAQLSAAGYHTIALDMRGHGESEWAHDGDYGIEALVADLAAVVATMPRPPVLVGASLGGLAALVLLGRQTDAAVALVLVDVAIQLEAVGVARTRDFMLSTLDGFASLEDAADAIAAYNPQRRRPVDISGLAAVLRRRDDGRWMWHWDPAFMGATDAAPPRGRDRTDPVLLATSAARVVVPTLLVRGRNSDMLGEEGARHLLRLIPDARYVDVAGAGHMVAGDRNDAFADAIIDFLAQLDRV